MNKKLFLVTLLLGLTAQAEISQEWYTGASCAKQAVQSNASGDMKVVDAIRCNSMYAQYHILEVTVPNLSYHKEIYTVDFNAAAADSINKKTNFTNYYDFKSWQESAALYMGQNNLGHDIFLIKLAISYSSYYVPSRPIHIYVKMGDQQLQVTDINLTPLK